MNQDNLPIAVIGAGPIGLAAAAHLIKRGLTPVIVEAGDSVGASVSKWAHVRMFSPWQYNVDKAAVELLKKSGWQQPDDESMPTGKELVEQYLKPLAALPEIERHIRLNSRVVSITRKGFDKMKSEGRDAAPFVLHIKNSSGVEERIIARAVIDASGTYTIPNPAGSGGVYAPGEQQQQATANNIFYGIPDVLGADRARYAGKRVVIIGSGHSAFNVLLDLATLSETEPATELTWVVRRSNTRTLFGGGEKDELPARGLLGNRAKQFIESGRVKLISGFNVSGFVGTNEGIIVESETESLPAADEIVVAAGFRPDLDILRELRLNLDDRVESPAALATLIDPNLHSCGTVYPHGAEELKHPEKDFYIVGMKSYGRAPTFLLLTGYEQVRSVVAAIAGDWTAARQVELVLPETGVCKTDDSGESCCGGGVAETFQLTREKTIVSEPVGIQPMPIAAEPVADDPNCCEPGCCAPAESVDTVAAANTTASFVQIGGIGRKRS